MAFARLRPVVGSSSLAPTRRFFATKSGIMAQWTHLIRFEAPDGNIYNGQPNFQDSPAEITTLQGLTARIIEGDIFGASSLTSKTVSVKKLLAPIQPSIYRCVGLNYRRHAEETKQSLPRNPILFIKPASSVQNPGDPIRVPAIATNNQVDYEVELAVVIGRPAKDVTKEEALSYVGGGCTDYSILSLSTTTPRLTHSSSILVPPATTGYTVCNDVSARKWQGATLSAGQWCFSKGFDTFAPLGPMLVSPSVITNPNNLRIGTRVNGVTLQDSSTSDMIFDIPTLISFLSQGTTLQPGDVIITGTPEGVGFTRNPPIFLQDGDDCECFIEKIGVLRNNIVYEKKVESKL
ncbi:FAA hydrolase putative [Endogone sp. FLAS-F59071]|nr:FAA hydrolase putative [Endogone sp. FLAS-F59071]|eukprot:RUS19426.1 FAA hydrolase putative [Endogone sp. FLAS-F59071]